MVVEGRGGAVIKERGKNREWMGRTEDRWTERKNREWTRRTKGREERG